MATKKARKSTKSLKAGKKIEAKKPLKAAAAGPIATGASLGMD